jgi:uncharacterized protein
MTQSRKAMACGLALLGAVIAAPSRAQDPVQIAQGRNITIGLIADGPGGTDLQIASEISDVLDDGIHQRILPMLGDGSAQNLADLVFLKGIDVAIVHTDVLTRELRSGRIPRIESVDYISKLFQEEVHILVRSDVTKLSDLNGKPVELGTSDSNTTGTPTTLMSALGIRPEPRHDPLNVALAYLQQHAVDAVVVVGGEPIPTLLAIPQSANLHLLPIPLNAKLVDSFLPGSLDAAHYPNLVQPGRPVETVAVGAALVTLAAPPNSDRTKRVNHFVDTLFDRFDRLRQPGFHPKWRDVSLAAQIPGLRRYPEAEKRLNPQPGTVVTARHHHDERHSGP